MTYYRKEYNSERTLQTSFCTCIEINPVSRAGIPEVGSLVKGEPMQKAIRMTPVDSMTIAELNSFKELMMKDANDGKPVPETQFCVVGKIKELDETER